MKECKNRGLNYCRMTIYRIGIAKGFLIHDGNKCIIDKDRFDKWLNDITESLPSDCEYIYNAVKSSNIPYSYFKYYFEKNNVEINIHFNGLRYVRKSDIDQVVDKYHQYTSKKGEQND